MIIECPSCQARYVVPVGAFASGGRKVRCARCREEWLAAVPTNIDVFSPLAEIARQQQAKPEGQRVPIPPPIPDAPQEAPVSGNLPALVSKFSLSRLLDKIGLSALKDDYAAIMADISWGKGVIRLILCAILAVLFVVWPIMDRDTIVKAMPFLRGAYEFAGFDIQLSGQGLVFDGVESEIKYDAGAMRLYVDGVIHNNTGDTQLIPDIRANALGPDRQSIQSWRFPAPALEVAAGSDVPFHTEVATPMQHTIDSVSLEFYPRQDEKGDAVE